MIPCPETRQERPGARGDGQHRSDLKSQRPAASLERGGSSSRFDGLSGRQADQAPVGDPEARAAGDQDQPRQSRAADGLGVSDELEWTEQDDGDDQGNVGGRHPRVGRRGDHDLHGPHDPGIDQSNDDSPE